MEVEDEIVLPRIIQDDQIEEKDARIAHLESQLSDQNLLKQQLTEAKARLNLAKSVVVPQQFFEYEEETDFVKTIDEVGFEKFVDEKCKSNIDREKKKTELKNKLLDQVRQVERKKRGMSISSIASIAWSEESSSRVRPRSADGEGGGDGGGHPKHSRAIHLQPK